MTDDDFDGEPFDYARVAQQEELFREFLRINPELRSVYERPGSGAVSMPFAFDDVPRVIELLRTLPDDAGYEAAREILAPYIVERQPYEDNGTEWRNRTRYDVGPDFERRAAEATLIALRAVLPNPEEARKWGYAVLPGTFGNKRSEVIEHLMALEKPVLCVGMGIAGAFVVGAWSVPPPQAGTPGVFENSRRRTLKWLRKQYGDREVHALLVGDGEELAMTAQEIEEWEELYSLPGVHPTRRHDDPLVAERGVDFVLRFERAPVIEGEPWEDME